MRDASQLPPKRHATLRIVVLIGAALAAGLRGLAYLPAIAEDLAPASLTYVEAWLPMWAWAWVWIAGFGFLIAAIFIPRLAIPSMSVFVAMHLLWGISFLMSWVFLETPRSWVTGSSILTLALFAAVLTMLVEKRRADPLEA